MAATDQDASIYQGEARTLRFTLTNAAGASYDPTGIDLFYRIAREAGSRSKVAYSRDGGITNAGAVVSVSLESDDTDELGAGDWYHELYEVENADDRHVLACGTLTVTAAQAARHTEAA